MPFVLTNTAKGLIRLLKHNQQAPKGSSGVGAARHARHRDISGAGDQGCDVGTVAAQNVFARREQQFLVSRDFLHTRCGQLNAVRRIGCVIRITTTGPRQARKGHLRPIRQCEKASRGIVCGGWSANLKERAADEPVIDGLQRRWRVLHLALQLHNHQTITTGARPTAKADSGLISEVVLHRRDLDGLLAEQHRAVSNVGAHEAMAPFASICKGATEAVHVYPRDAADVAATAAAVAPCADLTAVLAHQGEVAVSDR